MFPTFIACMHITVYILPLHVDMGREIMSSVSCNDAATVCVSLCVRMTSNHEHANKRVVGRHPHTLYTRVYIYALSVLYVIK
jgi:hypothetical protein